MIIKKMNNKGFTLVELLAVIVILAVLLLLAMPKALEIMENARMNAFQTEVRSYLKAAETKYTELAISSNSTSRCFSSEGTGVNLDIDNKSGYSYTIWVKYNSSTGGMTFAYYVSNGSNYYANSEAYGFVPYGNNIVPVPVETDDNNENSMAKKANACIAKYDDQTWPYKE